MTRPEAMPMPRIFGGWQEQRCRAGTEHTGIAGFVAAVVASSFCSIMIPSLAGNTLEASAVAVERDTYSTM